MSDALKAINEYLVADGGVSGQLGNRLYQLRAPTRPTVPYATMQRISEQHGSHMGGGDGLATMRLQVNVYAATRSSLQLIDEAFREAMHGFRGTMGTASLDVRSVVQDGPIDTFDDSEVESERGLFVSRVEYLVWYAESVPTF